MSDSQQIHSQVSQTSNVKPRHRKRLALGLGILVLFLIIMFVVSLLIVISNLTPQ